MSVSRVSSSAHAAAYSTAYAARGGTSTVSANMGMAYNTTRVAPGQHGTTAHTPARHPAVYTGPSVSHTTPQPAFDLATIGKIGTKLNARA